MIRARAEAHGRTVEVVAYLCDGAFKALMAGDMAKRDAIVAAGLRELMGQVDVVILAQNSAAPVRQVGAAE